MDAHRLAEERSIAMHAVVATRLDQQVVEAARARVAGWLADGSVAEEYALAWRDWLNIPVPELALRLVDPGESARAMRQVSPFAGVLGPRERWRIRREVSQALGLP